MHFSNKLKMTAVAASFPVLMSVVSGVQAAPILSFDFINNAGFGSYSPDKDANPILFPNGVFKGPGLQAVRVDTDPDPFVQNMETQNLPFQLLWGKCNGGYSPSCLSQLQLRAQNGAVNTAPTGQTTGTITTAFGAVPVAADFAESFNLAHLNRVINPFDQALSEAVLNTEVVLDPSLAAFEIVASFNIRFKETNNVLTGDNCPTGNPTGRACNDVFVLLNPEELSIVLGEQDGYLYTLHTQIEGLTDLDAEVCHLVDPDLDSCQGLITLEGATNLFKTGLAITAERIHVAEPGILALLGMSLMGVGVARRRRS